MRANLANRPSIERVRAVFVYDPETGVLRWRTTFGRAIEGQEAGGIDKSTGYHRVRVDGFLMLSHHVCWAIANGVWPERLDHVHGKAAGNRLDNLRIATQSQNVANIGRPSHNTSGLKGATFHKVTGKWAAQIGVKGKTIWLGAYDTKEEAHAVYSAAAKKHFGEFARTEDFVPAPAALPKPEKRQKSAKLTVEEIRDLLSYDPVTGELRWKRALGFRGQVGAIAGRLNSDGYRRIGVFYRQYPAHVLAWIIIKGVWPTKKIDHKNNQRSDNRWENLREATQSQNLANTPLSSRNTSGFRGVSKVEASGRWGAWIKVDGKTIRLGEFQTREEAYAVYREAAIKAWGEFTQLD